MKILEFELLTLSQTTNFRFFKDFANDNSRFDENDGELYKMLESSTKGQKTLWEKEKLLITNHFSPCPTVFSKDLHYRHENTNQGLFGKGLNRVLVANFHSQMKRNY